MLIIKVWVARRIATEILCVTKWNRDCSESLTEFTINGLVILNVLNEVAPKKNSDLLVQNGVECVILRCVYWAVQPPSTAIA